MLRDSSAGEYVVEWFGREDICDFGLRASFPCWYVPLGARKACVGRDTPAFSTRDLPVCGKSPSSGISSGYWMDGSSLPLKRDWPGQCVGREMGAEEGARTYPEAESREPGLR